jgi:hypothetical protein
MTDQAAPPPHPRRLRRILWRTGWVLLALVSFCVTYAVLVVGGH